MSVGPLRCPKCGKKEIKPPGRDSFAHCSNCGVRVDVKDGRIVRVR